MNYLTFLSGLICLLLSVGLIFWTQKKLRELGFVKEARIFTGVTTFWAFLTGGLGYSGLLSDFSGLPPRPFFILFPTLFAVFVTSLLPITGRILKKVPQETLIGIQSFRVPVEIFLWMLFLAGEIPVQMSFEGRNQDILSGIFGAVLYLFLRRHEVSKGILYLYNVLGLGLLINIVVTAVLSMPTVLRVFMNEPANRIVATFPFILLPTILVPFALFFHLLSLRKILQKL